jgi:D-tyrosyl-tRNA(Tyr) deacylase
MRSIIQRVTEATVEVDQNVVGSIKHGLLVLLGIEDEDNQEDIDWLARKIVQMRIFADETSNMNLSCLDVRGEILVVSQFTLHASTKKGNRPSFIKSASPEKAKKDYIQFVEHIKQTYPVKVETGVFGADMKVSLVNDGPVTIFIDSKNKE